MTPLMVFTLAWIAGILAAQAVSLPLVWLLLLLPAALILRWGWGDTPVGRWAIWITVGLLLGAGRLVLARPHIDAGHVAFYNGAGAVTLEGVVIEEPDRRPSSTYLRLRTETLALSSAPISVRHAPISVRGAVLLQVANFPRYNYGDRIRVTGMLQEPPVLPAFSYRDVLARREIYTLMRDPTITILAEHQACPFKERLYRFKDGALTVLHRLWPEPQAALLAGILLGVESGIPRDLNAAFAATGTSHIIAISGFNLTYIAGVIMLLARRFVGKRGEAPLALVGLWLYTLLVGASASVVRAAFMATLVILAGRSDRRIHGPTSLALAVLGMTLHNPYTLWDVGFLLSVSATAGLIFYTEPLARWFARVQAHAPAFLRADWVTGWLNDALIVTLAAQLTTTGVLIAVFQRLSLVTLVVNLLILPLQPFVMLFGGVALLVGLVIAPLGQAIGWIAWALLTVTIAIIQGMASFPLATIPLERVTLPVVWGYYAVLVGTTVVWRADARQRREWGAAFRAAPRWQLVAAAAGLLLGGMALAFLPDGRFHLTVLDVGRGDAIFIETPAGKQILVDGGGDAARTLAQLGQRMPFWDRKLEMVILTSPDEERLAGLVAVLQRYQVEYVLMGAESSESALYAQWRTLLEQRSTANTGVLWAGDEWPIERDLSVTALWPAPGDAGPLVLRWRYRGVAVLLPGDATTVVESALVERMGNTLRSDALQLARHGAKTSSTPVFLQAVAPQIVLVSAGGRTPAPETLARVLDLPVYRTDQHGAIELTSDGQTLTCRPRP